MLIYKDRGRAVIRKLYAMSKAIEGKPRLIGALSGDNGEFQFEYKLGDALPEWFLIGELERAWHLGMPENIWHGDPPPRCLFLIIKNYNCFYGRIFFACFARQESGLAEKEKKVK